MGQITWKIFMETISGISWKILGFEINVMRNFSEGRRFLKT